MEINLIETVKIFTIAFILLLITNFLKRFFLKNKPPGLIKEIFGFVSLAINVVAALAGTLVYTIISILLS